jgi:5-oxoprolinase (ATP-hydrolysing)
VKQLIQEYSLPYVQAQMAYIQKNAESSVRDMLRELVKKRGHSLQEPFKVSASDYMDDGSHLLLTLTINPMDGSAVFDFTGTDP